MVASSFSADANGMRLGLGCGPLQYPRRARRFNNDFMESTRRPIRPGILYRDIRAMALGDGDTKFVDRIRNPSTTRRKVGGDFSATPHSLCARMGACLMISFACLCFYIFVLVCVSMGFWKTYPTFFGV